jgi:hypothetical protein
VAGLFSLRHKACSLRSAALGGVGVVWGTPVVASLRRGAIKLARFARRRAGVQG